MTSTLFALRADARARAERTERLRAEKAEDAIERTFALSAGRSQIEVGDLPPEVQAAHVVPLSSAIALPEDGVDFERFVATIERELIERSLQRTGGNKGQAAKLLNIKRTTLVEKIKRLDKT